MIKTDESPLCTLWLQGGNWEPRCHWLKTKIPAVERGDAKANIYTTRHSYHFEDGFFLTEFLLG